MNTGESITTGQGAAAPGGKVRIYELAKELGLQNKELVAKVQSLGIEAKNHMSNLESEDVQRVKRAIDKERQANLVEERLSATVIRRRTKDGTAVRPSAPAVTAPPVGSATSAGAVAPGAAERPAARAAAVEARADEASDRAEARRDADRILDAQESTRTGGGAATEELPESAAGRTQARSVEPTPEEALSIRESAEARRGGAGADDRGGAEGAAAAPAAATPGGRNGQAATSPAAPETTSTAAASTSAPESRSASTEAARPETGGATTREAAPAATERTDRTSDRAPVAPSSARPEGIRTGGPRVVEITRTESGRRTIEPVRPAATADAGARAGTGQAATAAGAPSATAGAGAEATAAASGAATPEAPKKPEPVKLGPTGRVIELPHMRQPVIQVVPQPDSRGVRDLREKRDLSGRDRFGRQQHGKKKVQVGKKQKQTQITTPAAHKRVIKMEDTVAVNELAKQMSLKATDVLKKLWGMGMTGITMNSSIDADAAGIVAQEYGFEIENVAFQEANVVGEAEDAPEDLEPRAPVVTIMGHVDHGKTSLLDAIRNANVAAGEAGGITQHIGAYKVPSDAGDVVFLDTPGHEAFTAMRARGAQATDIVVLVVAADDGVMPTTIEALNHAKEADVTIIVAVNKIDKPNAQPERVRQQLSEHGLIPEAWGGETIFVDVSARNKTGIAQLLEMLALQAEVLELKANPSKLARGVVIEGKLDRNRGPVATVLVQDGTLKLGDTVVAGEQIGKVRAMLDDKGRTLSTAGPATPIELLGLSGVPGAGETFNAVADEKQAKELVEHRRDARRKKELAGSGRVSLENILDKIREGAVRELKIVLKADVQGSAEALKESLVRLGTEQVKVDVISAGVGGITESDVNLAKAGGAIIVGFHVRPAGKAAQLAEQEQVDIKLYDIIYEALDDVKKAMAGLLAPVKREKPLGKAEVRQVFTIPKVGAIAGCSVTDGNIRRSSQVRLVRDSVQIYQGKISSLRRFKEDVREVSQGYECGIGLENYADMKEGDVIEAYEIEEIAATLQ